MSLLQTEHQSLIFRDQLWASSFAALDLEQPFHQVGVVWLDGRNNKRHPSAKLFKIAHFLS